MWTSLHCPKYNRLYTNSGHCNDCSECTDKCNLVNTDEDLFSLFPSIDLSRHIINGKVCYYDCYIDLNTLSASDLVLLKSYIM